MRLAELELALNTGMRLSEQYSLRWQDVSFTRRTLTIPRSKNRSTRHVPLNQASLRALEFLQSRTNGSEMFCGGPRGVVRLGGLEPPTLGLRVHSDRFAASRTQMQ
jgi:integrase